MTDIVTLDDDGQPVDVAPFTDDEEAALLVALLRWREPRRATMSSDCA